MSVNGQAGQAPWPVRKGVFRSVGTSEHGNVRSPSPVIEIPETPTSTESPSKYATPINSPTTFTFEKARSPPLGNPMIIEFRAVRELPIDRNGQEVKPITLFSRPYSTLSTKPIKFTHNHNK